MRHIKASYADLAQIAELILKEGTVVEDERKHIIGFCKEFGEPTTISLSDTEPNCIYLNICIDVIIDKIISAYMKAGIYCSVKYDSRRTSITFFVVD